MLKVFEKLKNGKKAVIVCAGDSITQQNYHLNGYLNYVGHLGERFGCARIINAGVSGDDTNGLLMRFDDDVRRFNPDFVTVMFGINDSKLGIGNLPVFENNLMKIIQLVQKINAELLFLTQNPIMHNVNDKDVIIRSSYPEYVKRIRSVTNRCKVPLCDINKEWEVCVTENPQKGWPMMSDPLHPNEYGHKFMAQVLFQYLQV